MSHVHDHDARPRVCLRRPPRRRRLPVGLRHRLRGPAGRGRHHHPRRRRRATTLAAYCLMLGDDALVYSHRLSEWCSRAPDLEEDIALANIALDLLGQARLLLARAAAADPAWCPRCPRARRCRPRTRWRSSATTRDFRNVRLVEPDNGDFAVTIVRLLLFSTWRLALLERLAASRDPVLVGDRGQGRQGGDLPPRLRRSLVPHAGAGHRGVAPPAARPGCSLVWPLHDELFRRRTRRARGRRRRVSASTRRPSPTRSTCCSSRCSRSAASSGPTYRPSGRSAGGMGRDGRHTEALGHLLAEMQVVARAHPRGQW